MGAAGEAGFALAHDAPTALFDFRECPLLIAGKWCCVRGSAFDACDVAVCISAYHIEAGSGAALYFYGDLLAGLFHSFGRADVSLLRGRGHLRPSVF